MDYFFLAPILWLDCPTLPRSGIEIAPNMRISTDVEYLLNNRIAPAMYTGMGMLDKTELQTEQCFVVARAEPPKDMDMRPSSPDVSATHLALLDRLLQQLERWSFGMWCLKDHCINSGSAFLEYPYKSPDVPRLSQNTSGMRTTMADGKRRKVQFNRDELQFPMKFFLQTSPNDERIRIAIEEGVRSDGSAPEYEVEKYNRANRQERAMSLINIARGQQFLPFRIAMYVASMECLLSTRGDTDATEQIATRIAVLLNTYTELAGLEIYDGVKKAYNIRSRFIHGSVMPKKEVSMLPSVSRQCDEFLRHLLLITIGEPNVRDALDNDETLRQLFLKNLLQPISEY
jgi:hypothetical protein